MDAHSHAGLPEAPARDTILNFIKFLHNNPSTLSQITTALSIDAYDALKLITYARYNSFTVQASPGVRTLFSVIPPKAKP